MINQMNEEEILQQIQQLHVMAWGNIELVDEALAQSIEKVKPTWWKFWESYWDINWKKAADYIIKHRTEINEINAYDKDKLGL